MPPRCDQQPVVRLGMLRFCVPDALARRHLLAEPAQSALAASRPAHVSTHTSSVPSAAFLFCLMRMVNA